MTKQKKPADTAGAQQTEKALLEKKVSLELAQQISHVGSWDWNIQTGTLAWSDEIYRIFGLTPQEFGASYEAFLGFVHPEDRAGLEAAVGEAVAGTKPYEFEHRVVRKDDTLRFVHEKGEVFCDSQGNPTHMIGAVHDVTDIKLAWDKINDLNRDLEQRVKERTAELSCANAGLEQEIRERTKTQAELTAANQSLENTLAELRQTQAQLVQSGKMSALGQLVAGIAHEINTPAGAIKNAIAEIGTEYLDLLPRLSELAHQLTAVEISRFVQACQVVMRADRKKSTENQRTVARALRDALEGLNIPDPRETAQDLAFAGFTVETVAPLLELLAGPHREKVQRALRELGFSQTRVADIQMGIDRVIALVHALKNHSHMDKGKISRVHLGLALNDTLTILNSSLKSTIKVKKEFSTDPPVLCFADQLNQVWLNLVQNATHAMRSGGLLTVRLRTDSPAGTVTVEVEDTGHGIPLEVRDRIFEPYFSTKPKGEGMGLGLGICKQIVENHSGRLEIESGPQGTLARVVLPVDGHFPVGQGTSALPHSETILTV